MEVLIMPKNDEIRDYKEVGERIRKKRKLMNLTQEQLAKKLPASIELLSNWETGISCPRPIRLQRLADCLGTTPEYILNGPQNITFNASQMTDDLHNALYTIWTYLS